MILTKKRNHYTSYQKCNKRSSPHVYLYKYTWLKKSYAYMTCIEKPTSLKRHSYLDPVLLYLNPQCSLQVIHIPPFNVLPQSRWPIGKWLGTIAEQYSFTLCCTARRIQFICYCSKEASRPLVGWLMINFIENMKEWSQQNGSIARKVAINPGSWKFLKSKVNWTVKSTVCPQTCKVVSSQSPNSQN